MVQSVPVVTLTTKSAPLPNKLWYQMSGGEPKEGRHGGGGRRRSIKFGAPALGAASEFLSALVSHSVVVVVAAVWNFLEQQGI